MKIINYFKILSFLVLNVLSLNGVDAMGLSDVGKVCLFSEMSGVIKMDGKPAVGARLVRTVNKALTTSDETVTNEDGYFKF